MGVAEAGRCAGKNALLLILMISSVSVGIFKVSMGESDGVWTELLVRLRELGFVLTSWGESTMVMCCVEGGGRGMPAFRFQLKGTKWSGRRGPIGIRGTTMPFASNQRDWSVPGISPMHTPNSVMGTSFSGDPERTDIVRRLSSGCITIAQRPKAMGARCGLNPDRASFGVRGKEALQTELLRVSPTL